MGRISQWQSIPYRIPVPYRTAYHNLRAGRGRNFFLGVVEQLYRMRDRGIPAALRKLNRMRDCVVLMKKVVTVLLPLASVLLLVAARKDL